MRRVLIYLGVVAAAAAVVTGVATSAGTPPELQSRQAFAQHLQKLGVDHYMTGPAQAALAMAATGNRELGQGGLTADARLG